MLRFFWKSYDPYLLINNSLEKGITKYSEIYFSEKTVKQKYKYNWKWAVTCWQYSILTQHT